MDDKYKKLLLFLNETIEYFIQKLEAVDKDKYFADRDIRNILDKTINDIILCIVDISEELLKSHKRNIPETYKDTILSCYEFVGDAALKVGVSTELCKLINLSKHRRWTLPFLSLTPFTFTHLRWHLEIFITIHPEEFI